MGDKIKRPAKIKPINNFIMLAFLSIFQLVTGIAGSSSEDGFQYKVALSLLLLVGVEWVYTMFFYTAFHRRNFELEFISFFLSGVGLVTIGSQNPDACFKQFFMILAGVIVFVAMVFIMGQLEFCMKMRIVVAGGALLLLAANLVLAKTHLGARNIVEIGGIAIQPSEFVKVAFIFVGAATLEKIQTSKNIFAFIGFSLACVGSLVVIRDFGTALIFFVTFLIIAFMTSGDIKTIILAIGSAVMGAGIVLKYRSNIMRRFEVYRHVWEPDYFNGAGYQQTRVLVAMASGGMLGVGIGNGRLRGIGESTNDLIFGAICEEWGFIFGIAVVLSFVGIAVSALMNSIASRSTFYAIAAVAGAGMFLFQTALNIFGITDILPLTGVTLPFVSQGGSSMIASWGILAFIKASDIRTYNYLGGAKKK